MTQLTSTHYAGVFETRVAEDPNTIWDEIDEELGAPSSASRVTEHTAQHIASVFQAVNVIAGDVGQIPAIAYERTGEGKQRSAAHPAHRLMHRVPNAEMGPFQFKYLMQSRCLLWGNAYAYIEREGTLPTALWPIEPGTCYPFRVDGELFYYCTQDDVRPVRDSSEIFHLRGPGTEDLVGSSVVKLARESMSSNLQADTYSNRFLKNNATPPIALEFPEAVEKETALNILTRWQKRHAGPKNAGKPGFLDRGGKVNTYSMSHEDAQFLELRRFGKTEVASWFNLPPHKIGDLENATFSNIEQQSIDYVVFSLMPWLVRWQDECNRKLFSTEEITNDRFFVEFLTAALVRGDLHARMEAYSLGINAGMLTWNEVRASENLNPVPGGDRRLVPLNMAMVDENGNIVQQQGTAESNDTRALEVVVTRELEKLCCRLESAAHKAAKKPQEFLRWVDGGLENDHRKVIAESLAVMEEATNCQPALTGKIFERFKLLMLEASDGNPNSFGSRVASAAAEFSAVVPRKAAAHLIRGEKWNDDTPISQ